MDTVIGISGSLRKPWYNTALLRAAAELAPPTMKIELVSIREIPFYDGDVETTSGVPLVVAQLRDRIANANGILFATPEYNNSIPSVRQERHRLAHPAG